MMIVSEYVITRDVYFVCKLQTHQISIHEHIIHKASNFPFHAIGNLVFLLLTAIVGRAFIFRIFVLEKSFKEFIILFVGSEILTNIGNKTYRTRFSWKIGGKNVNYVDVTTFVMSFHLG